MQTQIAAGRVYDFSHAVGRSAASGTGFRHPCAIGTGTGADADAVYVISRGFEMIPNVHWNRTALGVRVSKVKPGLVSGEEELVTEFSTYGEDPGKVIWPAGIAVDSQGTVYVTDEWLNRISVFDSEGKFLKCWGETGAGERQFDGPSGILIDPQDNIYIVDTRNHRVQKLTKDGAHLATWGELGSAEGQLDAPWGIASDSEGYIYVADHMNHRVQKFAPEGAFVGSFGSPGTGRGELGRPSGVAVDPDGDIYICDWSNNRVQVFAADGRFVTTLLGDARELSHWAKMTVEANPDAVRRRREVRDPWVEWRLSMPNDLVFDAVHDRLIVADTQRQRIQIYNKLKDYTVPSRTI
jgi:DNA-binding beta-propeller fold protein YncE